MSESMQLVVLIAAVCGAVGYLIAKVIVPGARLVTKLVETLPLLQHLPILKTIESHFVSVEEKAERNRTQAVDFAATNRAAIIELQAAIGTLKELSRETRDQLVEVLRSGARTEASGVRMEEFGVRSEASGARTEASGIRTEASGARVEESGVRSEAADAVVASDLAASQQRADDVHDQDVPGSAADAASLPPDGS